MSYGIYVAGRRPKSKKAVREAITANPESVRLECTDMIGGRYDGSVSEAPAGRYDFVGPDPFSARNFYGNVVVSDRGVKVT